MAIYIGFSIPELFLDESLDWDDYIILVGGAPLNEEFAQSVGADAYCRDAAVAVETAKKLVSEFSDKTIA